MLNTRSEKEVLQDIKEVIQTHFGETGRNIQVKVKGDRVNLWGTLDTLAEKEFIGERIKQIDGVHALDNSLTVADDGNITDKEIEEWIREKFSDSNYEEIAGLGCRVSRGVVTLLGRVGIRSTERLAKRITAQVRGVKEVRSDIQLIDKDIDDASLVNRVENALATAPWVHAEQVQTKAADGVITLSGMVDTREEIEWAVETAYQVAGVKAVISEIVSRHRSQDEDLRMTEKLVSKLGEHRFNSSQVHAFVQDGIAFLSGEVYTDEDKERAEALVQFLPGITRVNNGIRVAAHSGK